MLLSIGVAVVLSFFYLIFLRLFTGVFTWLIILGYIAAFADIGYLFYSNYSGLSRYNLKFYIFWLLGTGGQPKILFYKFITMIFRFLQKAKMPGCINANNIFIF